MDATTRSGDYPAEFRLRAEELRSLAALVHDKRNRDILLRCAADYEEMALQYQEASAQGGVFNDPPQDSRRRTPG